MSATIDHIVRDHGAALLAYTTRLTRGDRHRAEDVVQETWIRAWRNVERLTEDCGSVRSWLMRVAHNIVVDHVRSPRARLTEVEMPVVDPTSVPERSDDVLNRLMVGTVLESLPRPHRETVVEVYFADRTAKSAAEVLRVPVGTVKSRVHNALRTLRETMPVLEAA
ncbi:sigma-70 family RNA polymerase sigma factor [Lentzea sp. DG1S-22]|uniref:sigma-70 family RNA polymerase sigma factor n=1 Tax=Lentzea sp. DG1S-22 TaxID=3108822 RepID=UPI002E76B090|nr:sigma-70 family RNA polymerase sigma factor [Lentzea sp. DG1S-22]WVH82388.1 sigma-70 family RNA polymerase sigma factor [Lentzea sp. DG1S-22]